MVPPNDAIKFFCPACGQRVSAPQHDAGRRVFCPSCQTSIEIPKASQSMRTVRIFISSPGDVADERDRARQVIESLRRRYAGHFGLKALLWEDLPLQPDMSFQQGIDKIIGMDEGVDIAVFILWSRLGSPVGATIRKADGSTYRSGTEREFDLMMAVRAQSGGVKPDILVYTRKDDGSFFERLRGKRTEETETLVNQKLLVEKFIAETFKDSETGSNIGAYHSFDRPVTFMQRLRSHLVALLDRLAGDYQPENVWDIESMGSPFMGLDAFQPSHAAVFFGREEQTLEARLALREQAKQGCAFLLLSGASGSGKSSLARAGILPAIIESEVDAQVATWRTLLLTPSELAPDPLLSLVQRMTAPDALPEVLVPDTSLEEIVRGLKESPELTLQLFFKPAFARAAKTAGGGVRMLIVLDQLEELFTSASIAAGERRSFLEVLERLACSGHVWVLATARADFYPLLQSEPALVRMKSGKGQMDVLPPDADGLRRLVEDPARLAGLKFEEREGTSLSSVILRDAVAHHELLPLVEYVLRELYEQRSQDGLLTFAAYHSLGGVEGALARRAEDVFLALPLSAQAALEVVLQALVTVGQNEKTEPTTNGTHDTLLRQRAPLSAFANQPGAAALVDAFVRERLFKADSHPQTGEAAVTVAHEALLRVWHRAATWAERNREFLRIRSHVAQRMQMGSPLLEGDPLTEAVKLHLSRGLEGFSPEQHAYVVACLQRLETERSRRKLARQGVVLGWAALALVAVISSIGVAVMFGKNTKITKERDDANKKLEDVRTTMANNNVAEASDPAGKISKVPTDDDTASVRRIGQWLIDAAREATSKGEFPKAHTKLAEAIALLSKVPDATQEHNEALADIWVEQSRAYEKPEQIQAAAKEKLREAKELRKKWPESWRIELATIRLENNSQLGKTDNRMAFKALAERIEPLVEKSRFAFEAIYASYITTGNIYRTTFEPVAGDYQGLRTAVSQMRKHLQAAHNLSRTELEILAKVVGHDVDFVRGKMEVPHFADTTEPRRALVTEFDTTLRLIEKMLGTETPSKVLLDAQEQLGQLQLAAVKEGFHTRSLAELEKAAERRKEMHQKLKSASGVADMLATALRNCAVKGGTEETLTDLKERVDGFQSLSAKEMAEVLVTPDVNDAMEAVTKASDTPGIREAQAMRGQLFELCLRSFLDGDSDDRATGLDGFTRAMLGEFQRWIDENKQASFIELWDRGLKDQHLAEMTDDGERDALMLTLQGCCVALFKSGRTDDARRCITAATAIGDAISKASHWDWYLRQRYMMFCFSAAEAMKGQRDSPEAQRLLRTAWTLGGEFWGVRAALDRYAVLPLKGEMPAGVRSQDAFLFERFLADGAKTTTKGSMKRFTVPSFTTAPRKEFPFSIYILSGDNGIKNYEDQILWLKKRRGLDVSPEISNAFRQLFRIAQENNQDFPELCLKVLVKKQ